MATTTVAKLRTQFFSYLFGESQRGYLCIATADPSKQKTSFNQHFFEWPNQKANMASFLEQVSKTKNVWFCVNLLEEKRRTKDVCMPTNIVWADLDLVTPDECDPRPTAAMKSSPGRYQGFWRLATDLLPPDVCEDYSRKLAYSVGADKSGWDLTQLLRVPYTRNFKYDDGPEVELLYAAELRVPQSIFEALPDPKIIEAEIDNPLDPIGEIPDLTSLPSPEQVMYKFSHKLLSTGFGPLYNEEPHDSDDWSARMWRLLCTCFEQGMERKEVFSIALTAKCNKYVRDGRPASYLWREVMKAEGTNRRSLADDGKLKPLVFPELVVPEEIAEDIDKNFISQYKSWATAATDAVVEYHELCCFIMLSVLVSSGVYLDLEHGELAPNLWGLVLGDSTLTRKTTAMNMVKDIILELDPDLLLANDGSAEGLITSISTRPNKVSLFARDEVTGFFDAINKKDYLAGLPQLLTELYDVPTVLVRQLRKETITINKPYFIFFGGGIKEKVHQLLNEDYILSGFLPRFLVVCGETDLTRIRRTGPATKSGVESKQNIMDRLRHLHALYTQTAEMNIAGQSTTLPKRYAARLTDEAWEIFGSYEDELTRIAAASPNRMLALPTFTRLAFHILKMSVLLAVTDNDPDENSTIQIDATHVRQAASYVQRWGRYSIEMIENTGLSFTERALQKVMNQITRNPGLTKSRIMNNIRLSSREANDILTTLADRGMIRVNKEGNGLRIYPVE